jgi:solute carrier family 45 protein 1/2/4
VDDPISIRLADARTPIREVDSEREVFLPGNASDSEDEEDEEEEEARKKEERRRVLGNPIAQRSGVDISGREDRVSDEEEEGEEEDYEIVGGPRQSSSIQSVRLTLQDEDDQVDGRHDHEGGLSSKAGIILVRFTPFFLLCVCLRLNKFHSHSFREYTTYSS